MKKLKSYHASFWPQHDKTRNQPKEKIWKDHKHIEVEEYTTEQWMGQTGNQKRNKIHENKWKWKHYSPKPLGWG